MPMNEDEMEEHLTINEMAYAAHVNASKKGFWPSVPELPASTETVLAKLMLIVTEVAEAAEYLRAPHIFARPGAEGPRVSLIPFIEELADIVIRVGDLSYALGLDLESAVILKMEKNLRRPYQHGKLA